MYSADNSAMDTDKKMQILKIMTKKLIFLLVVSFATSMLTIKAQEFNKNINKDSLLRIIINRFPEEKRKEYMETYNESSEEIKEFFLFMFSMPQSSKQELIDNYEKNLNQIIRLKDEYQKFVPENYSVFIEFNPKNIIINTEESIDLIIYTKKGMNDNWEFVYQGWNLKYDSPELTAQIGKVGWNMETVIKIKDLLLQANCISIENGEITAIGFARSGLGKYSYKIFNSDLTEKEISEYNDKCTYIYYKDNVVLEYEGGAIGAQCFPEN